MGELVALGQLLDEAQAFVGSPEFVAQYGALNNADFVNALYVNTLHRGADAAGSAYWVGVLNGGTSRGSVVTSFSESAEHQSNTAGNILSNDPASYGIRLA